MDPMNGSDDSNTAVPCSPRPTLAVHPMTGLSTDYLNHFNEAIMLLDMIKDCPDCGYELLDWKPKSYCEHFRQSGHGDRHQVIAAYDSACPHARLGLTVLADIMSELLQNTLAELRTVTSPDVIVSVAEAAARDLKPLVASAGAMINGCADADTPGAVSPQAEIDRLMAS